MVQYSKVAKRLVHHVCIFGDPKSGKSTLAATLAEAGYKLIWISTDNGHMILDELSPAAQERVNLIAIPDTKDNPRALHTVTKLFDGGLRKICDAHGELNCVVCNKNKAAFTEVNLSEIGPDTIVVLDSGSQVVESAIANITRREAKSVEAQDGYKLDYGDWATLGAVMSRILSNIQVARFHVIAITHSLAGEMEDGTTKLNPLFGSRDFSRNSGKYFDHVIFCAVKAGSHKIGSKTTFMHNITTGSRTKVVLEEGKEPDMLKIFGPPRRLGVEEIVTTVAEQEQLTEAAAVISEIQTTTSTTAEKDVEDALGVIDQHSNQSSNVDPAIAMKAFIGEQKPEATVTKLTALELLKKMNMGKK